MPAPVADAQVYTSAYTRKAIRFGPLSHRIPPSAEAEPATSVEQQFSASFPGVVQYTIDVRFVTWGYAPTSRPGTAVSHD